jgi:predicted transposase/invertase (TIGR01784 family)
VKSEEDLKMLESRNISPTLKEAVETLERMSLDRNLRIVAEAREKAIRDELSALATAELRGKKEGRAEGEKIGIEKGRAEERKEMIERMREKGFSEEQIALVIGEAD